MTHQEVCEAAKKTIAAIVRENVYADIRVFKEDRHDGRDTFIFSFGKEQER